ncbi:two-component system KDP operon response regulator KdpE [Prosthecobacter fusiformis]|uniref:Two-component system KDP operon response regulator KdpE n=1 Tax=Prosthecobacter fusiformis TaxID=48464 RepID=A0A4R7RZ30_9BACT|nr:response regulator transcription factor [Prosthecobacter fusiformis]TDU70639.1 two-component system KDP operon response regulator KdpE [Prosthecobacter fusiformis]
MTCLIIDDEVQIRRLLRLALESRGHTVREAEAGQQGLQEAAFHKPDAVLLDLGLPDMDGLEVLKRLREWSDVPVLILSVRDQESVKVAALENGADDYVTKPFGTAELMARLTAITRRQRSVEVADVTLGPLHVSFADHAVTLKGVEIKLTPTEYALMKAMARHPGKIITQQALIKTVWPGLNADQTASLRVHVNHLRSKIGSEVEIRNEPGIGYRLLSAEG